MSHRLPLALLVSGILVTSCFVMPAVADESSSLPASSDSSESRDGEPALEDAISVETADDASAIAVEFGHKVEVESKTDATKRVFALPNGNMELESSTTPVRMEVENEWVDIDPSLAVSPAGPIKPVATEVPLEFSPGGNGPLVRIQAASGEWISESWPLGGLPAPTLEGPTARYEDVLDGVDLLLTASSRGMTEVLVIGDEVAAAQPELQNLTLGIEGASLTTQPDGTLKAETLQESIVKASTPTWWDSSHTESSFQSPGGNGIGSKLDYTAGEDGLSLHINSATDQDNLVYPVFVDPDYFTGHDQHFWYIDKAYPSQSYLDGANASGSLRVGYIHSDYTQSSDAKTHLARAFFKMNTDELVGTHVLNADFEINEVWSFSCTKSTVELWRIGNLAAGSTWNETESWVWLQMLEDRYVAKGYSASCPDGTVVFDAKAGAQYAADHNEDYLRVGLRAADETTSQSWKRFSESALLRTEYNSYPNQPTSLRLSYPARSCGTGGSPAALNGLQDLTFRANASDDDDENIKTRFTLEDRSSTTLADRTVDSAYLADGATVATLTYSPASALIDGHTYRYYASTWDGTDWSIPSSSCYFKVDNVSPGLPTISPPAPGAKVGEPIDVTLGSVPADKVSVFAYWWEPIGAVASPQLAPVLGTPSTVAPLTAEQVLGKVRLVAPGNDGTAVIQTAPTNVDASLWVATYDAAGNVSKQGTVSTTGISVASAASSGVDYIAGHGWLPYKATPFASPIQDENNSTGAGLTSAAPIMLGTGIGIEEFADPSTPLKTLAMTFTTASGAAVTSHPVVDQGSSFTVSAQVRAGTITPGTEAVAVSQSGSANSGFIVKIGSTGKYEFCVRWKTGAAAQQCAVGPVAQSGSWVLVTGIWDAVNRQLRLHIDDSINPFTTRGLTDVEAVDSATTAPADLGIVVVGAEKVSNTFSHKWNGAISDLVVFPGVVSGPQLQSIFLHNAVN